MDKITGLLVRLTVCPGTYQSSYAICKDCPSCNVKNCKSDLKNKVIESLSHDSMPSLESRISEMLKELGVPTHIEGYDYLGSSIAICVENKSSLKSITGRLYPEIAKRYGTTPSRVERAIRHAIEVAWARGDLDVFNRYFGNTISPWRGKPTNKEFISCVVKYLIAEVQQS